MYDIYHRTTSDTFIELFTLSNIHHYQTRQATKQAYFIHYPRNNYKLHFITNQVKQIWEKIPLELKDLNRNTFNKKLTAHYINDYCYKI